MIATPLEISAERVTISGGVAGSAIHFFKFDPQDVAAFKLPEINGEPIILRPPHTFDSPYLKSAFGSARMSVEVGPI